MTNRQQKRRKVANNLTTPVGRHWTITRIVNQPEGKFGFAISDDGRDTCYIPRSIIERYGITSDDEGAGFTAPLKPGTGGGTQHPHLMHPFMWDAEDSEIDDLAAKIEEMGKLKVHIDHILEKNVEMMRVIENQNSVLTFMRNEISGTMTWLDSNYPEE